MCGIITIIGPKSQITQSLLAGLEALEYRGYDSAGMVLCHHNANEENVVTENFLSTVDNPTNSSYQKEIHQNYIWEKYYAVGQVQFLKSVYQQIANNFGNSLNITTDKFAFLPDYQASAKHYSCGIAHTRWATHGIPKLENTHPIQFGDVIIVHNGVIENHAAIKQELQQQGLEFTSETDTQVIAALIDQYLKQDDLNQDIGQTEKEERFYWAVAKAANQLSGMFAFVVISTIFPGIMVGVRRGLSLIVAESAEDSGIKLLVSDLMALPQGSYQITHLYDDDIIIVTQNKIEYLGLFGEKVKRDSAFFTKEASIDDSGSEHHFFREIKQQPQIWSDVIHYYLKTKNNTRRAEVLDPTAINLAVYDSIHIVACGSSYNAGCVARYWFEEMAKIHTTVEIASEFAFRNPVLNPKTLYIFVSQSGETADTIAAMQYVKQYQKHLENEKYQENHQIKTVAIINNELSQMARLADHIIHLKAKPEISVASTKSYTTQMLVLLLLTCQIIEVKKEELKLNAKIHSHNSINDQKFDHDAMIGSIIRLPQEVEKVFAITNLIADIAPRFAQSKQIIVIGRSHMYPIAIEAALKLKELTYIPSEGIAAGELKHGPLALVDSQIHIIAFAPDNDPVMFNKIMSNIHEIEARNGDVTLLSSSKGCAILENKCAAFLPLDLQDSLITPFVYSVAMQLLTYYLTLYLDNNVDKPRNLAKSVTVE